MSVDRDTNTLNKLKQGFPWLIGLLVGFNLITDGTSIGMLSATARYAIEEVN